MLAMRTVPFNLRAIRLEFVDICCKSPFVSSFVGFGASAEEFGQLGIMSVSSKAKSLVDLAVGLDTICTPLVGVSSAILPKNVTGGCVFLESGREIGVQSALIAHELASRDTVLNQILFVDAPAVQVLKLFTGNVGHSLLLVDEVSNAGDDIKEVVHPVPILHSQHRSFLQIGLRSAGGRMFPRTLGRAFGFLRLLVPFRTSFLLASSAPSFLLILLHTLLQ